MYKTFQIGLALFFACISFALFTEQQSPYNYPKYFPKPVIELAYSNATEAKIELGRALFYEPKLSSDESISCASCHSPYNAFAHTDHDLSHGIKDQIGTRNAPALFNLAWSKTFMWDGAVNHLDMQALAPISNPIEMNENIGNIVIKLQQTAIYPSLYKKAYGDSTITGTGLLKALSAFQASLISANSKYDQVMQGKASFNTQEKNGFTLFNQHCNSCHTAPLFTNFEFENNGLPMDTFLMDMGRYTITKKIADSLRFKVPSLRNLSYTFPYMHDGRFSNLFEVINHYAQNNKSSNFLSKKLNNPINLSDNEKVDLISFLLTLNDSSFVFNKNYHYPNNLLRITAGKQ